MLQNIVISSDYVTCSDILFCKYIDTRNQIFQSGIKLQQWKRDIELYFQQFRMHIIFILQLKRNG